MHSHYYQGGIQIKTATQSLQTTSKPMKKIYNNRGNAYFKNEDFNSAIKDYHQAWQLAPKNNEFLSNFLLAAWRLNEVKVKNGGGDDGNVDIGKAIKAYRWTDIVSDGMQGIHAEFEPHIQPVVDIVQNLPLW